MKSYSIDFMILSTIKEKKSASQHSILHNCNENLLRPRVIDGALTAKPKYLETCSHCEKNKK